jgi:hypothetical protein
MVPMRKRIQANLSRIGVNCDCPGEMLLLILWMSDFLCPQLASLLTAAKTVSQLKKGQNASRVTSTRTPKAGRNS